MSLKTDKDTLHILIQQHKKIIYKICYAYCQNPEDRKDLMQEIFIQLWKSFEKYNHQCKLSTWVYRVALNVSISFYRKSRLRQKNVQIPLESILVVEEYDYSEEQEANIKLLYQFIHQLDELHKALMILYLDDNNYKDIAEILGITETNVATKIYRIKQKMKKQFATL